MYCRTGLALHGTSSVFAREQSTCVFPSIGARTPALVLVLLAIRAVSWNPQRRCAGSLTVRSEEHTSELQSHLNLVCRLLLEKKKNTTYERDSQSPSMAVTRVRAKAHHVS